MSYDLAERLRVNLLLIGGCFLAAGPHWAGITAIALGLIAIVTELRRSPR